MAGRPWAGSAVLCCAVPGRWEEGGLFPQSFSLTSLQSGCLLCPGLEAMPAALPRRRQSHPSHHYQPLTAPLVSGGRKGLKYAAVGLHCWELAFQVTPCTLAAYLGNAAESSWEAKHTLLQFQDLLRHRFCHQTSFAGKKKKNCCWYRKHNKTSYESLRRAAVGGHEVKPQFSEACLTNEDKAP